tara:strand:+ start:3741 stop:3938 length:198 start_codon:yes stop_codon:yes gene_type:complete
MLARNVGTIDRILRIVIGAALLVAFFMSPDSGLRWLYLIGLIPLVTGLLGSCLMYRLFGYSTYRS